MYDLPLSILVNDSTIEGVNLTYLSLMTSDSRELVNKSCTGSNFGYSLNTDSSLNDLREGLFLIKVTRC